MMKIPLHMLRALLTWRMIFVSMTVGLLLFTVHGFSWDDVYIVRTRDHAVCKFPDGSYFEYLEREKWFFYVEPLPFHAQTSAFLDRERKYRSETWSTKEGIGFANNVAWTKHGPELLSTALTASASPCISVGKIGNRAFTIGAYQDHTGKWIEFLIDKDRGLHSSLLPNLPKIIPAASVDKPIEIREFLDDRILYAEGGAFFVVPLDATGTLLLEQPLTAFAKFDAERRFLSDHPSSPFGTVLLVYQSISVDFGKTWSKPLITRDAKLFEIGKLLEQQSWSAKPTKAWSRSAAR